MTDPQPILFGRQSGRTTRMLEEARRLRDEGRAVYVLVHSEQYKKTLCTPQNEGLRFETWDSLRLSIDERTLTLRMAHPNGVLLVDHHALESRYSAVLDRLRRGW